MPELTAQKWDESGRGKEGMGTRNEGKEGGICQFQKCLFLVAIEKKSCRKQLFYGLLFKYFNTKIWRIHALNPCHPYVLFPNFSLVTAFCRRLLLRGRREEQLIKSPLPAFWLLLLFVNAHCSEGRCNGREIVRFL